MAATAQTAPTSTTQIVGETNAARQVMVKIVVYTLLIGFSILEFIPFVWALSTSLNAKANDTSTAGLLPAEPTLSNYTKLFDTAPFFLWFANSLGIAIVTVLLTLFFSSTSGYAFARIPFPGRDLVFLLILGTMMIPGIITFVPIYQIATFLGIYNTYQGLILPFMVTAFGIFLMRQFFTSVPVELEEAARIDGAGRIRTFAQVVLPLARPALSALALFQFMGRWNDFTMPLILIRDRNLFTLPLGMSSFRTEYKTDWGLLMSGAILITIPIVVLYIAFQRFFVEGISYTGLKG